MHASNSIWPEKIESGNRIRRYASEPSVINNQREISAFNLSYDEFSISELT